MIHPTMLSGFPAGTYWLVFPQLPPSSRRAESGANIFLLDVPNLTAAKTPRICFQCNSLGLRRTSSERLPSSCLLSTRLVLPNESLKVITHPFVEPLLPID